MFPARISAFDDFLFCALQQYGPVVAAVAIFKQLIRFECPLDPAKLALH